MSPSSPALNWNLALRQWRSHQLSSSCQMKPVSFSVWTEADNLMIRGLCHSILERVGSDQRVVSSMSGTRRICWMVAFLGVSINQIFNRWRKSTITCGGCEMNQNWNACDQNTLLVPNVRPLKRNLEKNRRCTSKRFSWHASTNDAVGCKCRIITVEPCDWQHWAVRP
jgi:hypothetical protein